MKAESPKERAYSIDLGIAHGDVDPVWSAPDDSPEQIAQRQRLAVALAQNRQSLLGMTARADKRLIAKPLDAAGDPVDMWGYLSGSLTNTSSAYETQDGKRYLFRSGNYLAVDTEAGEGNVVTIVKADTSTGDGFVAESELTAFSGKIENVEQMQAAVAAAQDEMAKLPIAY